MKETLKINGEFNLIIWKLEREKQRDNMKIQDLERKRQIDNKIIQDLERGTKILPRISEKIVSNKSNRQLETEENLILCQNCGVNEEELKECEECWDLFCSKCLIFHIQAKHKVYI